MRNKPYLTSTRFKPVTHKTTTTMSDFDNIPEYPTINRTVVMVVAKQPFFDWANAVFPGTTPIQPEHMIEHFSFLIDNELLLDNPKDTLRKYWKAIFAQLLNGACTDPDTWPKLSWKLFTLWFDCHFSSMVFDLQDEPLYLESYD